MLSNAAANALLKTLEEPPGHVVFVLATTDPQKVPPTIRSRTQHFEFRLLGADTLAELVRDVNEAAGLSLDDDALSVAVRRGRGSARDALSALDQVAAAGDGRRRPTGAGRGGRGDRRGRRRPGAGDAGGPARGRMGSPATGGGAGRRPAPGLPGRAGARAGGAGAEPVRSGRSGSGCRGWSGPWKRWVGPRSRCATRPTPGWCSRWRLVRLARPELDDSPAALGDRLARVERALAGGVAAAATGEPPATPRVPAPHRERGRRSRRGLSRRSRWQRPRQRRAPPIGLRGPCRRHRAQQAPAPRAPAQQAPAQPAPPVPQAPVEEAPVAPAALDRDIAGRGLGRSRAARAAGPGQGALQRRPVRGGRGRPGGVRPAQRRPPRPVRRGAAARRGGAGRPLRGSRAPRLEVEGATARLPPGAGSRPSLGRGPGRRGRARAGRRRGTGRRHGAGGRRPGCSRRSPGPRRCPARCTPARSGR